MGPGDNGCLDYFAKTWRLWFWIPQAHHSGLDDSDVRGSKPHSQLMSQFSAHTPQKEPWELIAHALTAWVTRDAVAFPHTVRQAASLSHIYATNPFLKVVILRVRSPLPCLSWRCWALLESIKEIYYPYWKRYPCRWASIFTDEKLLSTNPQDSLLELNMKFPVYAVWCFKQ